MSQILDCEGVREYGEGSPVTVEVDHPWTQKRPIVVAYCDSGGIATSVDLEDLLLWTKHHLPELWNSIPDKTPTPQQIQEHNTL